MSEGPAEREVCLRPEHAAEHPEIPPGRWLPARQVAECIVRRAAAARHLDIHRQMRASDEVSYGGLGWPRPVHRT